MDILLTVNELTVRPDNYKRIVVDLVGVQNKDVLDYFDMQECIDHFGLSDLLDQIGMEDVKKHFDLTEKE